jgi:hypothetical protein
MTPDPTDLTAALAGIRERRASRAKHAPGLGAPAADFDRLLGAVEAVLKEHQPVNRGEGLEPICSACHRGFWPCPTVQAITAALTGKEPGA